MEKLDDFLKEKITESKYKDGILSESYLENLQNVYPFNKFEFVMSHLIDEGIIGIDEYNDIRNKYIERNKFLFLFEKSPRVFGETWAQNHLNELVQELRRPSKDLDAQYSGEYDFWYNGIKIEVKASRAVKRESGDSLMMKALSTDSAQGFDMNFQQLKPKCCDVFVWMAVWKDAIKYWVLSSKEVQGNPYYSTGQHRGNTGEGQLWLKETNIKEFDPYLVEPKDILEKIVEKSK